MGTWWMVAGLGLALGVKHALDADHVVAVTAMVSETKSISRSSLLGVMWGLGHSVALLAVGMVLLAFRVTMPATLAMAFEYGVGLMLVTLGSNVLRTVWAERFHIHAHDHADGLRHLHLHAHHGNATHYHAHRSFAVGLLHGLAGSAALTLLVAASAPTVVEGLLFIAIFCLGSVVGMLAVSSAMAVPFLVTRRLDAVHRSVKLLAGGLSVALGLMIAGELTAVAWR